MKSRMAAIMITLVGILHVVDPTVQSAIINWVGFRSNRDMMGFLFLSYFILFAAASMRAERKHKRLLRENREDKEASSLLT